MPTDKRALLERVRIYLIADGPEGVPAERLLRAAIAGGVGMVQLREKNLDDGRLLESAIACARLCRELGVPFIVNDRVDIALACNADGVHVGQDDLPVAAVRALLGERAIIGLSTHSREQIDEAANLAVDYIGVGPVFATPTKPGRDGVGPELIRYAAKRAAQPFFAIGGVDQTTIAEVVRAGARGVSVLRCISHAVDPQRAARELLERIDDAERVFAG